jgi:branched-chain amino acid transport system substrate-binding protein
MKRLAALVACCAVWATSQQGPPDPQRPYKDGRGSPHRFEGPGRELPDPPDLREVLIGYYGPGDETHIDGGAVWQGATLAIETANRSGGYRGKPFRLLPRWSENPWRAGAALVTRMAFVDRVPVLVGSIEGAGTHLAEQVVAKALLPLVNPVATDRSIHMAGVPWMFSVVQGDDLHSAVLAQALRGQSIVILSTTDHDSRAFCGSFRKACARLDVRIKLLLEFEPGRPDLSEIARGASRAGPDCVVVIGDTRDSARAVQSLRDAPFRGLIAGGPLFGRSSFTKLAGAAADGAIFPWVGEPAAGFRRIFAERFGSEPDYAAACAYDSLSLVVAAIRRSGLNRVRLRDSIVEMAPYEGASGRIDWDEFGQNHRPPALGVIAGGKPSRADSLTRVRSFP